MDLVRIAFELLLSYIDAEWNSLFIWHLRELNERMGSFLSNFDLFVDFFRGRWSISVVLIAHLVDIILIVRLDSIVTRWRV